MIPIQLLCNAVRMSSVSVHICADTQIAKKSERKGRRRRREICLRLQTELLVKLLCLFSPFSGMPHCLPLPLNSPDLHTKLSGGIPLGVDSSLLLYSVIQLFCTHCFLVPLGFVLQYWSNFIRQNDL